MNGQYDYLEDRPRAIYNIAKKKGDRLCSECGRLVENEKDDLCPICRSWVNRGGGFYP